MNDVELHPLEPFLPEGARMLMLGSFPPSRRRWCMDFFYPNFQNDFWRIFGIVFFGDIDRFVDREAAAFRRDDIVRFLTDKGIAIYDTACAVRRTKNTASDKDLEIVEETDLDALLRQARTFAASYYCVFHLRAVLFIIGKIRHYRRQKKTFYANFSFYCLFKEMQDIVCVKTANSIQRFKRPSFSVQKAAF